MSRLKDKIDIKGKTEEHLDKRHKICKRNTKNSVTPSKEQAC
jgi:hypothetical protein